MTGGERVRAALAREITSLRALCATKGDDAPVLQTVFSPFTLARKVAGAERVREAMARNLAR